MGFWFDDRTGILRFDRLVFVVIMFGIGIWFVFSAFVIIPAGHRGVVLLLGAVQEGILNEGFHVITPFVNSVQVMEVRTLKYEVDSSAATGDLLDVRTKVAVNYHISPTAVNTIFQTVGLDFEGRIIVPAVQEVVKATTAKFDAEKLITQRASVKVQLEDALKSRLGERGLIVETISITDFQFPTQFNQAITDKQTAVQLKLKAENDLERIKVEAQQAIAKAEGDAESIRIINEQLQKSPQYIQFIATQKWDGKLPPLLSGVLPFVQVPSTPIGQ